VQQNSSAICKTDNKGIEDFRLIEGLLMLYFGFGAAIPNEVNQGVKNEVWCLQMSSEQR